MRPFGGDEEDRTPDPLLAKQVLSQLSYTPIQFSCILKIEQCLRLPVPLTLRVGKTFLREALPLVFP